MADYTPETGYAEALKRIAACRKQGQTDLDLNVLSLTTVPPEEIDQASGQAPQAPHRRRVAYHEERRNGASPREGSSSASDARPFPPHDAWALGALPWRN